MIYDVENLSQRIDKLMALFDLAKFRRTKAGFLSSGPSLWLRGRRPAMASAGGR
jgi:hypothetical protein